MNSLLVLQKSLSPAQQERRMALLRAVEALAIEGGYAGASLSAVAEHAGVSRPTVYQYFSSKDHLLAELNIVLGERFTWIVNEQVLDTPDSRRELLRRLVRDMVEDGLRKPRLLSAVLATVSSPEPAVVTACQELQSLMHQRFHRVLEAGSVSPDEAHTRAAILRHVFSSCLIGLSTGQLERDEALRQLDATIELICVDLG
jgi:AcrR family transcriptional regulator